MTSLPRATTLLALVPSLLIACKGGDKKSPPATGTGTGTSAGTGTAAPTKAPTKAPARGPEHAVYSLIDNRLSAHLHRGGGLLLAGGSAGFAKYTRFGNTEKIKTPTWQLRQTQDSTKVAIMSGASARVDVPVSSAELAGGPVIRVRVYSAAARPFSVRVNGNKDVASEAPAGWGVVEFKPPPEQLKEGENELPLIVTRGGGGGSARPQPATARAGAVAKAASRRRRSR